MAALLWAHLALIHAATIWGAAAGRSAATGAGAPLVSGLISVSAAGLYKFAVNIAELAVDHVGDERLAESESTVAGA